MRPMKSPPLETAEPPEFDEYAATLIWHDGDKAAAIRTLLADCRHLREQLALSRIAMSLGFTRGWMPSPDRNDA